MPAASPMSLDRWWADFNDPQLGELIEMALERSTTARMAYARIAEARALRNQSRATTLPSGGLTGSASEQGSRSLWGAGVSQGGQDAYQLNFNPSWEIDLFGRLAAIRSRADLDNAVSTFDFYGVRLTLAADVANALIQARYLAVQLDEAEDGLRIARELAKTGELGFSHGLSAGQDVARLRADVASGEAEVSRLIAALQIAKRALLILVGRPSAPTASLAIDRVLATPPLLPAITPGMLLARRPDVLSAEMALQSASATVKIDRLALFPQFNLQPGIGLSASGGAASGIWSIVAGLALPILDRARLLASLRVSEARGQQAVISYERAVQAAFGEAEQALVNVAADKQRVVQLKLATDEAQSAFISARKGYSAGLTDLTTVLQTERVWRQNRATLYAAQASHLTDTISTIRAFGGGWNPSSSAAFQPIQTPTSENH